VDTFSSPRACVAAVLEMQHDLQQHDWPAGERGFYFSGEPEKGLPLGEEAVEWARRLGDDVLAER
jgi:hypothetical protein